jgi:hypothetical protein
LKTTNSGILTEKLKADHGVDALTARLNLQILSVVDLAA